MNSALPFGLLVCAAAGAVLWWWPADAAATSGPETQVSEPAPVTKAEPPVLAARWTAPAAVKQVDKETRRKMVELPNGDFVAALNGAIDAPKMSWPADLPYSPILGVERAPDGKDWWVHADGSKSTTEMVFRSDLGRYDGVTEVANPTPALPLEPEEAKRAQGAIDGKRTGQTGNAGSGSAGIGKGTGSEIKKQ